MVKSWNKNKNDPRNISFFDAVECPQCHSKHPLKLDQKEECQGCKDQGSDSCRMNSCEKTVYYQTSKSYAQHFICTSCGLEFVVYKRF
jgi:hypothetical protein